MAEPTGQKRHRLTESEVERIVLKEAHHALDSGLISAALNITSWLLSLNTDSPYLTQQYKVFDCGVVGRTNIMIWRGDQCAYDAGAGCIKVGADLVKRGNKKELASMIFHELGHKVNHVKSDSASQLKKDFENPLLLSMKETDYKEICRDIYRFHSRELKARCFEATMWLKKSMEANDKMPTLDEYYSARCTDINMMKNFISQLKQIASEGEDGESAKIIDGLYREMDKDSVFSKNRKPFDQRAQIVLGWFEKQFSWFKKRADKIYADVCQRSGNFAQCESLRRVPTTTDSRYSIQERVDRVFENIIAENRESKNMSKARNWIRQNWPQIDAQELIDKIRRDIPNSRIADCKFLTGVARMVMNKELMEQEQMAAINKTLRLIGSDAHVNEYDNNLNNESASTLIRRFSVNVRAELDNRKSEIDSEQYQENHRYKIVPIDSFEDAEPYGEYTSWCVAHHENMFKQYTHGGMGRFYFCLRDDYQTVRAEEGENCPLDDYGLSMIAVSVNDDGSVNTITCRWNHDNDGNDNIMTDQELSRLIGRNFYQTFKPWSPEEIEAKRQHILIEFSDFISNYGNDEFVKSQCEVIETDEEDEAGREMYIFRSRDFDELSELGDVCMVVNQDMEPIINDFYDDAYDFYSSDTYDGMCVGVCKGNHWNVLKSNGTLLLSGSPNEWPLGIKNESCGTVGRYVGCRYSDHSSIIRVSDGFPIIARYLSHNNYVHGAGFFLMEDKTFRFYDLVDGKMVLDGIVKTDSKPVDGTTFGLEFVNDRGKFYMYRRKGGRLLRLSNVPYIRRAEYLGEENVASVVGVDGKIFRINLDYGKAYDRNGNCIEPQTTQEEGLQRLVNRVVAEAFGRF